MAYENLKAAIKQAIKQNDNQEITGNLLQSTLLNIVNTLEADYKFLGFAMPSTVPPTSEEGSLLYFASAAGEYVNFPTSGENTYIVTGEGLYMFTKKANSDYWKEEILIEITQEFGNSEDKAISQNLATIIAACSSVKMPYTLDVVCKTEKGYLTNTGSITPMSSGVTLSFTINESKDLYLYATGLADRTSNWATYAIFNSNNELKYVGPTTLNAVTRYSNCFIKIDEANITSGDIIKVSVSKLVGHAVLFYSTYDGIRTIKPDFEEQAINISNALGISQKLKVSENISTFLQACNSSIKLNKNSEVKFKTEIGYLLSDGSVLHLSSGMILSFTITDSKPFVSNGKVFRDLYLYISGLADVDKKFVSYIIYDSAGKIKHKGETLDKVNTHCINAILHIDKSLLEIGDVIKVSVNKNIGGSVLISENNPGDNYFYSFSIPDTENEAADNNKLNQWEGKKIVWIGTSIPWGQTSETGQTNPMANPYPKQIGELLGCTVLNHAQPGMSIRYNKNGTVRYRQCLSLTVKELQEKGLATTPFKSYENAVLGFDADLYVFDSEPNNGSVPSDGDLELLESFSIKNWAYSDNSDFASHRDTFVGAFIYMYDKLLNEKPNAKVILVGEYGGTGMGVGNGSEWETEYYNHTLSIAIAKKFNLPIFSLFELLGYNPKNIDIYMNADRVHPKYATHIRMANILKEKLLEVF